LLSPGDIYVSLKDVTQSADLLGAVARVPSHIPWGRLTQDTVKLVFKNEDSPQAYLYWLLQTPQYREYCRAHSTGTTNLGLAREDFLNFEVPPLTRERQWIAALLQHIEDKIELNKRMNSKLETLAQAIFRDWFVDFGPVHRKIGGAIDSVVILGGLISDGARAAELAALFPNSLSEEGLPAGWRTGELGNLAQSVGSVVAPSSLPAATPYIGLEHMPRRSIMLDEWGDARDVSSAKVSFKRGDILFGKLRPYFHKVGIAPLDGVASTDIIVLSAKRPFDRALVGACVSTVEFVGFANQGSDGTKMPRTSWAKMQRYSIPVANEPVRIGFQSIVGTFFEKILSSVSENRALGETRDYLLPRLMSGKVRVANAERIAG